MISVNEIRLSCEQELIKFSFGQGMTSALFQTFGIFSLFREVLNILIMTGASISAYVFQNQYGMSSGSDVVRFSFRMKLYTMSFANKCNLSLMLPLFSTLRRKFHLQKSFYKLVFGI